MQDAENLTQEGMDRERTPGVAEELCAMLPLGHDAIAVLVNLQQLCSTACDQATQNFSTEGVAHELLL